MNFLRRRRARFLIKRPRLQKLPGFDNEVFVRVMGVSDEGISWLWRR